MNHRLTLIVTFFSFVQTSFREFGEVGLACTLRVYKVFRKTGQETALGPPVLHYLHCPSEWVCFPERLATTKGLLQAEMKEH